jgi:hypothetical protein
MDYLYDIDPSFLGSGTTYQRYKHYDPLNAPNTIEIKVSRRVDRSLLENAIALANEKTSSDFTYASWTAVLEALAEANAALTKAGVEQEEIDAACAMLSEAIDALVPRVSAREDLDAAIARAESLDAFLYASGWEGLQTALDDAKALRGDAGAYDAEIDAVFAALVEAMNGLERKPVYAVDMTVENIDANLSFYRTEKFDAEGFDVLGLAIKATKSADQNGKAVYSLSVPAGTYSLRGTAQLYEKDGSEKRASDIGGVSFTVPSQNATQYNMRDSFRLVVASIYSSQSFVKFESMDDIAAYIPLAAGDDYLVAAKDAAGRRLKIGAVHNTAASSSGQRAFAVPLLTTLASSVPYTVSIEPTVAKRDHYLRTETQINVNAKSGGFNIKMDEIYPITAPAEATVTVYAQPKYYLNHLLEPIKTICNGDGTKTVWYDDTGNGTYITRVSMPGKVTKAGWGIAWARNVVFENEEDPGDTTTTFLADRDGNSMLMNIPDGDNFLKLNVGETFTLRCFRAWEIICNDWLNKMIEPDFRFRTLEGEDVLTFAPHDAVNGNWIDITAKKEGTAIIEVTYDAIDVFNADYPLYGYGGRFGAVNQERKGIVVVTVGQGKDKEILIRAGGDSEFDTMFLTRRNGETDVSLYETDGTKALPLEKDAVAVAWNPDVPNSLHEVSDGKMTIYAGNNIVKATVEGRDYYKIVRAGSIRLAYEDEGRAPQAGDEVRILYGGSIPSYPLPKMSGLYNPQQYSRLAAYDDPFALTEDHINGTPLKVGERVGTGGLGSPAGTHRYAEYDNGLEINMNAGASSGGGLLTIPDVRLSDLLKADLEDTIIAADLLNEDDYGTGWDGLTSALSAAKRTLADEDVIITDIYDAGKALKTAISELKKDPPEPPAPVSYRSELKNSLSYLAKSVKEANFGTIGGEWTIIALKRGNYDEATPEFYSDYYERLVATIKTIGSAKLSGTKSTENSRVILALSALGKDATDAGGFNLLKPLADFDWLTRQGINGPLYALLALDSNGYEVPRDSGISTQTSRARIIEYILGKEIKKGTPNAGGWSLAGSSPDPDITSAVLCALAPYCDANANVKAAAERALAALSKLQSDDGGFASWGSQNAESCAQVVTALAALGIDPQTDARFVKANGNPIVALLRFQTKDGGFKHVLNGGVNAMATDQSAYALVAYDRLKNNKNSLFDMRDAFAKEEPEDEENGEIPDDKTDDAIPGGKKDDELPDDKGSKDKDGEYATTPIIGSDENANPEILPILAPRAKPAAIKGGGSVVIPLEIGQATEVESNIGAFDSEAPQDRAISDRPVPSADVADETTNGPSLKTIIGVVAAVIAALIASVLIRRMRKERSEKKQAA